MHEQSIQSTAQENVRKFSEILDHFEIFKSNNLNEERPKN